MNLNRIAEITKVFAEEGLGFLTERPKAPAPGATEAEKTAAEHLADAEIGRRLRRTLERLGPTFVKFGQMLGTRVDLFSPELVAELAQLHSHVAPFPTEEARAILTKELGRDVDEVFEALEGPPIAAASIAQVYKARLRGSDAGWVAVKVQRPGLEASLLSDLDLLIEISGFIDRIVPQYHRSMVHRVAEEYAHRARAEIDFVAEAQAIEDFREVLSTLPELCVPAVHRALSSRRVLVMEWLEGTKLDTVGTKEELAALGFDPATFARTLLKMQLSMAYEHGFVHGDTHPGNIILLPDHRVGLIDFGLHARVPRALRDKMLEMILAQASGRIDDAIEAFVTVFAPDPSLDIEAFKGELRKVLTAAHGARSIQEGRITGQLLEGMRAGARYNLKAQSELFIVIRNLTIVEGIVLRYCPTIDPVAEMRTITADIVRRRFFGRSMQEQVMQLVPQVLFTLSQRPRLAERLMRLERSFTEAKNLGDFLRRESVITEPPARRTDTLLLAIVAAASLATGAFLHFTFG